MNLAVLGGGPAGLYFALLMKKADPAHRITVLERNGADDTFGWGVVFSAQTLGNFQAADAPTYDEIGAHFARWDDIDVHVKGSVITSGGHGFSGIARRTLLDILRRRAAGLGVDLRFGCEVRDFAALPAALGDGDGQPGERNGCTGVPDLIVAADGVNSLVRRHFAEHFQPDLDVRTARYIWLGTTRLFDAFTFLFVDRRGGGDGRGRTGPADGADRADGCDGVFQAHAYRFDDRHSAFIEIGRAHV